jgi:DNA polymerase-3 subunit alpha
MDRFGCSRRALLQGLDKVQALAQKRAKRSTTGQLSLLGLVEENTCNLTGLGIEGEEANLPEFGDDEKCRMEKEAFGFFLIGHPLQPFRQEIRRLGYFGLSQCADLPEKTPVQVPVLVTATKTITTKKGDRMAFCAIEDLSGSGEAIVFSEPYAAYRDLLACEEPLLLTGTVAKRDALAEDNGDEGPKKPKLLAESFKLLSEVVGSGSEPVVLLVRANGASPDWDGLQGILRRYPGQAPVLIDLVRTEYVCRMQFGPDHMVAPCPEFWREFEQWRNS